MEESEMKKIFRAVVVFAVLLNVSFGAAQAAEKAKVVVPAVVAPEPVKTPPVVAAATTPAAEKKEMTREDMVTRVREMCQYHPDMLPAIPGLAVKEADGKKVYEFNGKKLEDLDKDTITKLFKEANRFVSFKNTQRFEQQMKTIKQIDNINKMNRQLRKPYNPNIPKTYNPPKAYTSPKPYRAPGK